MLNKELEQSLNKAFHDANEKRHEFITVEHLLLMLTENDAAAAVRLSRLRAVLREMLEV